jgi:hypothetical protein
MKVLLRNPGQQTLKRYGGWHSRQHQFAIDKCQLDFAVVFQPGRFGQRYSAAAQPGCFPIFARALEPP